MTRATDAISDMQAALKDHEDFGPFYDPAEVEDIERRIAVMKEQAQAEREQEQESDDNA